MRSVGEKQTNETMYGDAVAEHGAEYGVTEDEMEGEMLYIIRGSRKTLMRCLSGDLDEARSEPRRCLGKSVPDRGPRD